MEYLDTCRVMRDDGAEKAIPLFAKLAEASADTTFIHYQLPVAAVAKLRLAQCHDLSGQREKAAKHFSDLDADHIDSLIREAAKPWIAQHFTIPSGGNPLLREYNLAWLDRKIQTPLRS